MIDLLVGWLVGSGMTKEKKQSIRDLRFLLGVVCPNGDLIVVASAIMYNCLCLSLSVCV